VVPLANAAIVSGGVIFNHPVSASSAYSVPQLLLSPVPHSPALSLTWRAHERLIADVRPIRMRVHVIDWMIVR